MTSDNLCVLCGTELRVAIEAPPTTYAAPGAYGVAECPACGLGHTSPAPSEAALRDLYAQDYGYGAHDLIAPEKRWRSAQILSRVVGASDHSILDIGCMQGFLLDAAKARGIARRQGIELSPGPAEEARRKGHDVFGGTVEEFARDRGDAPGFDVIVAQHVLEHVVDLASFVATTRQLLAPGGKLCLCVPNFSSKLRRALPRSWSWYQVPAHVYHFTLPSLARLLEKVGLHIDRSFENGGDSLFLLMTGVNTVSSQAPGQMRKAPSLALRMGVRPVSRVLRSYFHLGDDELMVVASEQKH